MKTIKLTSDEKKYIKNIKGLNNKRNHLQDLIINKFLNNTLSKKVVIAGHPRMGKSIICLKIIQLLNTKFQGLHLICCPTSHIKNDFIKLFESNNITNVVVTTYQATFTKKFLSKYTNQQWLSVFTDENDCGVASNTSIQWSKVLNYNSRWHIALSGTFSDSNITFLEQHGFDVMVDIDLDTGVSIGTLPSFDVYNLGVDLTLVEQQEYYKCITLQEQLIIPYRKIWQTGNWANYAISVITPGKHLIKIDGIIKSGDAWMQLLVQSTGWNIGVLLGRKKRWNEARNKINEILEIADNKIKAIDEIVNRFNNKGIIFTTRKDTCDKIVNINKDVIAYYSGSDEQVLKDFRINNKKAIVSVNKISRGFTESGISYAINSNYNSTSNGYIQKISRALSLDDNQDKNAIIINLYCKDFRMKGQLIESKDVKKLIKAQDNQMVYWIDVIEDIND